MLANRLHSVLARSAFFSRAYLQLWGFLLRRFGGMIPARRVVSTLSWHAWPPLTFSARSVSVTDTVSFNVLPHTGEYDMRALFTRDLAYEGEVFAALDQCITDYDAVIEIGANVGFFHFIFALRDAQPPSSFIVSSRRHSRSLGLLPTWRKIMRRMCSRSRPQSLIPQA